MAASAPSGVAAEIQGLLSAARKATDGAERAKTLRNATFELLERGTSLLREVVPQIMEFMDDRAPLVRACVVRFIVELALRSPLWLPQLAATLERACSDDHEIVQASIGRAVSQLYPLALAMRVANPQTGEVMPTTPPKVEAAWAVMEQLRDAVAALSISPNAPDAVRLPAIAALRGAALAHSLPSVLSVRVAERAARAAAAAGVLSVARSAQASAPAITGLCLRPTAGTAVATEEAAKALARSRKRESDALSLSKALEQEDADDWPAPLIGVPADDILSGASIPGSHGTVDAAACLSTGDDAVAVLALLLCRNPSADAAEAGTAPPRCPFTARTYSALLAALADVAAARPGLVDAAVQGIVGFGATPPKDLVPGGAASLADLPPPVAAALRAAIIKVLRKAGSAVRQSHKVALQTTLATLGAAAEGEAAAAAGLRLPLWSIIATDTPVWDLGAAAPAAALMGWGGAASQPPPPTADETAAMASLSAAARGEDSSAETARAAEKARGSALDRAAGVVLSDAELLNQMRAITPAARRKVALAALAALPYPTLDGAGPPAEGSGSGEGQATLSGAAFLAARNGGAGVIEWAAETGGFACAGAVRLAVAPLVRELEAAAQAAASGSTVASGSRGDSRGGVAAGAGAAAVSGKHTDALADLAAAFGAAHDDDPAAPDGVAAGVPGSGGAGDPAGPGIVGVAGKAGMEHAVDDEGDDDEEGDDEGEGGAAAPGAGGTTRERAAAAAAASAAAVIVAAQGLELEPLSAKRAWVQANEAFRRVAKTPPELLAASGRHALRSAARVTALLATDPSLAWAVTLGGVPLRTDGADATLPPAFSAAAEAAAAAAKAASKAANDDDGSASSSSASNLQQQAVQRARVLAAVPAARAAREAMATGLGAASWAHGWRTTCGVLWRVWARERVTLQGQLEPPSSEIAGSPAAYGPAALALVHRVVGVATPPPAASGPGNGEEVARGTAAPSGTLRGVLLSLPLPPPGFGAAVCDAVEQGSLEASEGLEVLGDIARARPGARAEAVAAGLRLCVAWSSETRRHAVGLMVLSLLALAPDQVEAFATRAFWSLAVSDEVPEEEEAGEEEEGEEEEEEEEEEEAGGPAEEDQAEDQTGAADEEDGAEDGEGEDEAEAGESGEGAEGDSSAALPSEAVLAELESSAPVSKGDAVRRAQLLVGVATRRQGLLAEVVAPVYAVAPRQRAAIDQELDPLLAMLLGAPGGDGAEHAVRSASSAAGGGLAEASEALRTADPVWERRALVRAVVRAAASREQQAEVKSRVAAARQLGRAMEADAEAAVTVLRMPSRHLLAVARRLFVRGSVDGAPASTVLEVGAEWAREHGAATDTAGRPASTSSSSAAAAVAAPAAAAAGQEDATGLAEGADDAGYGAAAEAADAAAVVAPASAQTAGVAAAIPDPGTCRLGPGLRGDAGILVPVARGLAPSELVFVLGRLAASSDPKAARTFTSFVNVLFSSNACPVPYQARDDRPGVAPGAIFSRATFLLAVVSNALGVRSIDPARHRSAVVSCVRDPACFPDDVVRSALSPLTASPSPPATLYGALTLAAQGRQEAGRRLVAALLDDLRRSSPWKPRDGAQADGKEPGAKRVKTEAGLTDAAGGADISSQDEAGADLENHWRGFVGVAKACVPLSLPVVARLPSARVVLLVADEGCATLVGRLKEWASNSRVRRAYGVTVEVLEALGVEDTSDAPSESATGALTGAVALPQVAAAHRPGLPGVFGLPGMMQGPGPAGPGAMGLSQMGRRPPMPMQMMSGQMGFNPGMVMGAQQGLGMHRAGNMPAALMLRQRQLMMAGGAQGPWMGGAPGRMGRPAPGMGMAAMGAQRGPAMHRGAPGPPGAAGAGAARSLAEGGSGRTGGAAKRPRDT